MRDDSATSVKDGRADISKPLWNFNAFISESIPSVLCQTYTQRELRILDDSLTANTDEVVTLFADSRIKYFTNSRDVGAALQQNRALREARKEWMAFLDSDARWFPEKRERPRASLKDNGHVFPSTNISSRTRTIRHEIASQIRY